MVENSFNGISQSRCMNPLYAKACTLMGAFGVPETAGGIGITVTVFETRELLKRSLARNRCEKPLDKLSTVPDKGFCETSKVSFEFQVVPPSKLTSIRYAKRPGSDEFQKTVACSSPASTEIFVGKPVVLLDMASVLT